MNGGMDAVLVSLRKCLTRSDPPNPRILPYVVCAEQTEARFLILDPEKSWDDPAAILWQWETRSESFGAPAEWFAGPSECKIVALPDSGEFGLLVTSSGGAAALIGLQSRTPYFLVWAGDNPHSAALLPRDRIAVVSTHGNKISIFRRSDGRLEHQEDFPDAHGVEWDAAFGLLRVIGSHELASFRVMPDGRLIQENRFILPRFALGGHDLAPVGRSGCYFLSGHQAISVFDPAADRVEELCARHHIKSISLSDDDPEMGVLLVQQPARAWGNDSLYFLDGGDSALRKAGTLPNAFFYKARWVPRACLNVRA